MPQESNVSINLASAQETTFGVAPTASDPSQRLRRATISLAPAKDSFRSNEVREDQQLSDFRHGLLRPGGGIEGELAIGAWDDFIEVAMRSDWVAGASLDETDFTSVASDSGTSKFTFGGGDPIALGMRVGDVIRFGSLATAANNSVNFRITAFGGASNREVTVYPAPTTGGADTAFTVVVQGHKIVFGTTRKSLAIEMRAPNLDHSELYLGSRINTFGLRVPPTGPATTQWGVMAREMQRLTAGSSPYFTNITAATTNLIMAGMNGNIRVAGEEIAVMTGFDMTVNNNLAYEPVIGANKTPFLYDGDIMVAGNMSAIVEDETLLDLFDDETEFDFVAQMNGIGSAPIDFMCFGMQRVKMTGISRQVAAQGAYVVSFPWAALIKANATGYDTTTLTIQRSG